MACPTAMDPRWDSRSSSAFFDTADARLASFGKPRGGLPSRWRPWTLLGGLLPAGAAYIGQLIVDAVVTASQTHAATGRIEYEPILQWVVLEGVIIASIAAVQRTISVCESLLRAMLGHRVNVLILEKALTLDLSHFEDSEFYDKLTRARRQASSRPLSLVRRTFGLTQNAISLLSYAGLLWQFSPWAVAVLVVAGLPAFVAETKFSGDAFRLFRWRSPETRKQTYLETVLAREDYVKEVKLYGLGPLLLQRYREIFEQLFHEDRRLTLRRGTWGFVLGLVGTTAFYAAYAWIAYETVVGSITLGQMTMYLLVFRQGQSAVSAGLNAIGGMYEDNLYLSNLYEYLEQDVAVPDGVKASGRIPLTVSGSKTCRSYIPGADKPALEGVSLHLQPGQTLALVGENGSGKTTLIKLLTRLYTPSTGRITIDGLDIQQWSEEALRRRVGVIFQDFARYQMLVGENVGAGDVEHFADEERWREAAAKGMADQFIDELPDGVRDATGAVVQGRPRALGRSMAEGGAVAGLSCAAKPTFSSWTSPPRRWMRRPKRRSSSTFATSPRTR